MQKVFLGGTCNESSWRNDVAVNFEINYFNPVVDVWTEECYQKELQEREICDYCLYVITPKMTGAYSIAEAVDDSNKRPTKTIFCFLKEDENFTFNKGQLKSLDKVGLMIESNGGKYFRSLSAAVDYLNSLSN